MILNAYKRFRDDAPRRGMTPTIMNKVRNAGCRAIPRRDPPEGEGFRAGSHAVDQRVLQGLGKFIGFSRVRQ